MTQPPALSKTVETTFAHYTSRGTQKTEGGVIPKTFATHKSTYLYLATTILFRIFPLNDVSVVAEINHLRSSRPKLVAGIQNNYFRVPR